MSLCSSSAICFVRCCSSFEYNWFSVTPLPPLFSKVSEIGLVVSLSGNYRTLVLLGSSFPHNESPFWRLWLPSTLVGWSFVPYRNYTSRKVKSSLPPKLWTCPHRNFLLVLREKRFNHNTNPSLRFVVLRTGSFQCLPRVQIKSFLPIFRERTTSIGKAICCVRFC